jgi:signal transduction histidine kinase
MAQQLGENARQIRFKDGTSLAGLGLSISYDIVTQEHGGTITVDSRVGEFTEFTVRLPRTLTSERAAA